ncbi:hypothetical protein QZH41_013345 [Actinostola sp. cb2023]|nr:hypothetical protein QZH41_013345 [Actinostola sp. cb2023]
MNERLFKREMYSHLERIQSQYRLHDGSDGSHGNPTTATLSRDLQENKRLAHETCESLRREIDHIKTRIAKVELETHSTLADARDSARRLERLDRTVNVLSENQRSQSHSLESMVDDRDMRTFELGSIREKISELSRHVSDRESDSQGRRKQQTRRPASGSSSSSSANKASNQTKPLPKTTGKNSLVNGYSSSATPKKSKRKTKAPELEISLSDSDLDMSSALLGISSDSDSDLTSIQLNSHSYKVEIHPEISDLSSASLSSLNSDELLAL